MNFYFFSAKQLVALFALLSIFAFSASESAVISRVRRQSYGVLNNVVNDGLLGGPSSLGWAQVPHVMSPMFSPVFGR